MLTSLNVTTRTLATKRAGRYMSHTHASLQLELEVGPAVLGADVELHLVGEVEATLGLDDVLEHRQDVAVLLVELELDLGLVPLEILGAHRAVSVASTRARLRPLPYGRRPDAVHVRTRFSLIFAAFPIRSRR